MASVCPGLRGFPGCKSVRMKSLRDQLKGQGRSVGNVSKEASVAGGEGMGLAVGKEAAHMLHGPWSRSWPRAMKPRVSGVYPEPREYIH